MGYPPAPWRLHGELTLIPALVRAGRFPLPPRVRPLSAAGFTIGGALLARYAGGTLAYHELIVLSGMGAAARLSLRAAPALVTLETPGPFAPLGLAGTRLALAGDGMRLFMSAVRL